MKYGLSLLHCWIRFFEFVLHVSYKLEIQKWQDRSSCEKENVKNRKSQIQIRFKSQLNLIVDQPKVGHGNSNDGNTTRKAFRHHSKFSEITGVKEELIIRLYVILQAMSSNCQIKLAEFENYCLDTAKLFLKEYNWYKMPPSVHKVLFHGRDIIEDHVLPI